VSAEFFYVLLLFLFLSPNIVYFVPVAFLLYYPAKRVQFGGMNLPWICPYGVGLPICSETLSSKTLAGEEELGRSFGRSLGSCEVEKVDEVDTDPPAGDTLVSDDESGKVDEADTDSPAGATLVSDDEADLGFSSNPKTSHATHQRDVAWITAGPLLLGLAKLIAV
jgi:hypothetical protein